MEKTRTTWPHGTLTAFVLASAIPSISATIVPKVSAMDLNACRYVLLIFLYTRSEECPRGDGFNTDNDDIERQLIQCIADAGSFTLTFRDETTKDIPYNSVEADIKSALEELSTIGEVEVVFSGGTVAVPIRIECIAAGPNQRQRERWIWKSCGCHGWRYTPGRNVCQRNTGERLVFEPRHLRLHHGHLHMPCELRW